MKKISYSEWMAHYIPVCDFSGDMRRFDPALKSDVHFITSIPEKFVWTETDDDRIIPGKSYVNRLNYVVTLTPHLGDEYMDYSEGE